MTCEDEIKDMMAAALKDVILERSQHFIIGTLKGLEALFPGTEFHVAVSLCAIENETEPQCISVIGARTPRETDDDTPTGKAERDLMLDALMACHAKLERDGEHIKNVMA